MSHKRRMWSTGVAVAVALLWIVSGCSERPSLLQPSPGSKKYAPLVRTTRGKLAGAEQWIEKTQQVTWEGGTITVGDEEIGMSSLVVPPFAIPQDVGAVAITMSVSTTGPVVVGFTPHLEFKVPVTVAISYRGADLGGAVESGLTILFNNEMQGEWEPVQSDPRPVGLEVVGALSHFSQYAVGSENRGGGG